MSDVERPPGILDRIRALRGDAFVAAILLIGAVATLPIPRRADRWVVERLSGLVLRWKRRNLPTVAARLAGALSIDEAAALEHAERSYRQRVEGWWGRIRGVQRGGWRPDVSLEGEEYLRAALDAGRGAIVWRMGFHTSSIAKWALFDAGYPLTHLSMRTHGAGTDGWLANRILRPLVRRTENWFLHERVVFADRRAVGYMKRLVAALRANHVVLVFGDLWGLNGVPVSVLGRPATFATGAPRLALKTGATLLTAYVERVDTLRYRLVIEPPVATPRDGPRDAFVRSTVEEFARRLDTAVRLHPEGWTSWGVFYSGDRPFEPADQTE